MKQSKKNEIANEVFDLMSDDKISERAYERLGKIYDELCDPVLKGNRPVRLIITYVTI